jgi:serine/threonine protein kinase
MEANQELDPKWRELLGQVLQGKIRVDSVAGIGGFGIVFKAFHLQFHRPVALKCLRIPHGFSVAQIRLLMERFRGEAQHLHDLVQEGAPVVGAHEIGEGVFSHGEKFPYIVLDWMEGQSFDDWCIQRQLIPMSLPDAIRVLEPAARAFHIAHRLGIVHRDIKPNNLFMVRTRSGEESVKVLDFGIAKAIQASLSDRSLGTHEVGIRQFTAQYGTPEQFDYIPNGTGPWTDVFAFALVLVWVLTGREPLEGDSVLQWHVAATRPDKRPTPNQRGASLDLLVEQVFQRALAVKPMERFMSAGEFWAALCDSAQVARPAWLPNMIVPPPQSPRLSGPLPATILDVSPPKTNPSPSVHPPSHPDLKGSFSAQIDRSSPQTENVILIPSNHKSKKSRARWWIGTGAGVLLLLLVVGGSLWSQDKDPPPMQPITTSVNLVASSPLPIPQNHCSGIVPGDELLVFRETTSQDWEVSPPIRNDQRYFASKGMRFVADGVHQSQFVKVRNYDKFYPCSAVKKP